MDGIGRQFMEQTKYAFLQDSPQKRGEKQPPLERPLEPGAQLIALPDPASCSHKAEPLLGLINRRRTIRRYADAKLSPAELSFLLWSCQGVQETGAKHTMRTVPSAGARHAFETYVLVNRVEGLQSGLYRYTALKHGLVAIDLSAGVADALTAACLGQGMVSASAVTVFWAAEVARMYFRYGERGYRYLHLDAGHACQNLYLAAEAAGCGACAIAAFGDDAVNEALGLDGENMFVVYIAAAGKKPE